MINNSQANSLYKLQDNSSGFVSNSFPIRRLVKSSFDHEQAWIAAYRAENKKHFEAVLTNQKLDELEREELEKDKKSLPKRSILKNDLFRKNEDLATLKKNSTLLDGFYLMQLCCVEDPLNLSIVDISTKDLTQIKEEDMNLFENIIEIKANENFLNLESFRNFPNLKDLYLACNNIKTIRLRHEDFICLETLDLSFNNLTPIDIAHLGILKSLKYLKLTGNNLEFLPDTFSKLYVHTKDNKKIVSEKFPNLEELFLDNNKIREEDSFDVLSVLKKLKRLHLNSNNISCIPNLKIFRKNLVFQEFNKSYYKKKKMKQKSASSNASNPKNLDSILNESIVKDLDRPSSEMNIHNANTLRNSFILEENEEELVEEETGSATQQQQQHYQQSPNEKQNQNKFSNNSIDTFEKNFDLPFPELVYINLADNQISEEDDLIALASWPMLNEIIVYGNPIVYNNVGFPPIIKQYLIDRLGINIHKQRPLKPLKTPLLIPQREHRMVDSTVPKVPKMPIELKMLTYYQDSGDQHNKRSNVSSADSNDRNMNSLMSSEESLDTVGHNLFKPFKQDKVLDSFKNENENNLKNFDSFFMTQIDQDENVEIINIENPKDNSTKSKNKPKKQISENPLSKSKNNDQSVKNYDILYNIENEEELAVPKDFRGSIRALKQMLDNPLVFRDPNNQLDKPQVPFRTTLKDKAEKPEKSNTKINQINEILDSLKEKKTVSEMNLADALKKIDDKNQYEKAKNLFDKAQRKYEEVKRESLKTLNAGKI